jgi:competence protein ComEA
MTALRSLALLLAAAPALCAAVEANSATRAELERLPGLGVATTESILKARAERPFADWNDLASRVAGIGGRRAEQLGRQGLTVNGRPHPAGGQGKK